MRSQEKKEKLRRFLKWNMEDGWSWKWKGSDRRVMGEDELSSHLEDDNDEQMEMERKSWMWNQRSGNGSK